MGIAAKFGAGILMTLFYVIAVPYITDTYITPYIVEAVGDNTFLFFGSQTLIQFLIILVMLIFMFLLGGGAILRWCGIFGVLGMVVAYYLMGNIEGAIIPLISVTVAFIVTIPLRARKKAKKDVKELKKKIKEKRKRK